MQPARLVVTAIAAALLLIGAANCAQSATADAADGSSPTEVTRVLRASSHNPNMQVTTVFSGPSGLVGAVFEVGSGQKSVAWLTSDLKVVIPGAIYDAAGANLTERALRSQKVYLSPADALTRAATVAARPVMVGRTGPIVTFFMDPNCSFCHALYQQLAKPVEQGKLRVRYVLVGLIRPTSAARSAAILSAPDPAAALAKDETSFDSAAEEGGYGVPRAFAPTAAVKDAVAANGKLMFEAGGMGTPTLLYCSAKTGKVAMEQGVPKNLSDWIGEISSTGHAACAK